MTTEHSDGAPDAGVIGDAKGVPIHSLQVTLYLDNAGAKCYAVRVFGDPDVVTSYGMVELLRRSLVNDTE